MQTGAPLDVDREAAYAAAVIYLRNHIRPMHPAATLSPLDPHVIQVYLANRSAESGPSGASEYIWDARVSCAPAYTRMLHIVLDRATQAFTVIEGPCFEP